MAFASSRRPVVLIVDDHQDTCDMYSEFLRVAGFATAQATDGMDGLAQACTQVPDVVVTDMVLRGPMDGLTLTRRLRHDARTRHVRIIVLTGRTFQFDREEAERAGCDVFLTKPCLPDALAAEVWRLMDSVDDARKPPRSAQARSARHAH